MKVLVSGGKMDLRVTVNGELIGSKLNVFETFMLLGGLCRDKAHSVQLKIEKPTNDGLAVWFQQGLDTKQIVAREQKQRRLRTLKAVRQLEEQIRNNRQMMNVCIDQLAQHRASLKKSRVARRTNK